ncbi:MAG: plastocyanin [Planctomycetota bacterium]|jgi:plastocyanin
MTSKITLALLLCTPAVSAQVTHQVSIQNQQFVPAIITIQLGDSVRWTNNDQILHTVSEGTDHVVNGNEAFHSTLWQSGQFLEHTFDAAFLASFPRTNDTYPYFCEPHNWMTGTVAVTSPSEPGSGYGFCTAGPCGNDDASAGCENTTGSGALLSATGSPSVSSDNLVLRATQLRPNQPAVYFMGPNAIDAPFGDGRRVVGGSLNRFSVQFIGGAGDLNLGPGIADYASANFSVASQITSGSTWRFQCWYRDPGGPCGSGHNLTNGYAVPFSL